MTFDNSEIVIYQTDDGRTKIDVRMEEETVWLSQAQMVELFRTTKQNVSLHINNAFAEGKLEQDSVVKYSLTTAADGKNYRTRYYSLDVIISGGYRAESLRGTQFRRWALEVLKEYPQEGLCNDDLLEKAGSGNYRHELLERIRDLKCSLALCHNEAERSPLRPLVGIFALRPRRISRKE